MEYSLEIIFVIAGGLLLASIIASKLSGRFGVPSLILFLIIGMIAGSDGLGGIPFDDPQIAQWLGVTALVIILFSGGLDTEWKEVRPVLWKGLSLATFGVGITTTLVGLFVHLVMGLPLTEGLLLGAIVSSTDAAAVLSILRTQSIKLTGRIQPLLELESGSNDPMAVFLTTALVGILTGGGATPGGMVFTFLLEMTLGAALGYLAGRIGVLVIGRIKLEIEGLYSVLTLAMALLTFGGVSALHGNGFLAVYVAGIVIGNSAIPYRRMMTRFTDALAWLMQIIMFLALGLLVFPSRLPSVAGQGLLMTAFLIAVARPVAVFVSLAGSELSMRQKTLVSWVGLRGAVPIILATFPLLAHLPRAGLFFNLVFFIVLISVTLQGASISTIARWLKVGEPVDPRPRAPIEFERTEGTRTDLREITVAEGSAAAGRALMDLNLPAEALIVLINRRSEYIVARGDTTIQPGDVLLLLAPPEMHESVEALAAPRGISGN